MDVAVSDKYYKKENPSIDMIKMNYILQLDTDVNYIQVKKMSKTFADIRKKMEFPASIRKNTNDPHKIQALKTFLEEFRYSCDPQKPCSFDTIQPAVHPSPPYEFDVIFNEPKDFNLNILQGPINYRIDLLPAELKQRFKKEFEDHIEWLSPRDPIQRAVGGFQAAIAFMMSTDNSHMLPEFWKTVMDLDWARNESLEEVVPELSEIAEYKPEDRRLPIDRNHRVLKQHSQFE